MSKSEPMCSFDGKDCDINGEDFKEEDITPDAPPPSEVKRRLSKEAEAKAKPKWKPLWPPDPVPEIIYDREEALEAVRKNGRMLDFCCDEFKNDYDLIYEAISQTGFALQYASNEMQRNRILTLHALRNSGAYRYEKELARAKAQGFEHVPLTGPGTLEPPYHLVEEEVMDLKTEKAKLEAELAAAKA